MSDIVFPDGVVFIDLETRSVDVRWDHTPEDYIRLYQYGIGEREPVVTEDRREFMRVIRRAKMIVAHNGHAFDWSVLFGKDSLTPVHLARAGRLFDTLIHAKVAAPPPFGEYVDHNGHTRRCDKPEQFRKWFSLANLGYQLGVDGKLFDLSDLATEYSTTLEPVLTKTGKPSMTTDKTTGEKVPRTRRTPIPGIEDPYAAIPVTDERFRAYAAQDITALRNVARALLARYPWNDYARRLQLDMAILAQLGRNGWLTDTDLARADVRAQDEEAAWTLNELSSEFGLPVAGAKPLATKAGKEALAAALAGVGVPLSDLEVTATGNPSFGADSVVAACKGHGDRAEALASAVATLAGQRSQAQLVIESTRKDGRVHPEMMPIQRSDRVSTSKPGLTIFDARGKRYYLADPDHLLVEFDYAACDARAVAAMSGDAEYAKRFSEEIDDEWADRIRRLPVFAKRFADGMDAHTMTAVMTWGEQAVAADLEAYRQKAKAPNHGWNYSMGPNTMAKHTGLPVSECKAIVKALNTAYPKVVAWKERVTKRAQRYGYVLNDWGGPLFVEPGREFTQTPGLLGQNATTRLLNDGLAQLPDRNLRQARATIHDALVACIPVATLDKDIAIFKEALSTTWHPKGGMSIDFVLASGTPGRTWSEAAH